ncbi:DUF2065 domain-containing protein [Paraglaciecola aestuariivivens]
MVESQMYNLFDAILIALAIVFVLEGIGPMLFARKWQNFLSYLSQQPSQQLRTTGGVLFTIGLVCLFYLI